MFAGIGQQEQRILNEQQLDLSQSLRENNEFEELRQRLYEIMEMSQESVPFEDLLKRLTKEHKFSVKVNKLVKDTEDL